MPGHLQIETILSPRHSWLSGLAWFLWKHAKCQDQTPCPAGANIVRNNKYLNDTKCIVKSEVFSPDIEARKLVNL